MDERTKRTPEELADDLDAAEVAELEDGDLEEVAGGGVIQPNEPNTNCNNSSCCR